MTMKSTPKQLEYARRYRESHKEQYRKYFREYHKRFPQKQCLKAKLWRRKIGLQALAAERALERKQNPEYWKSVQDRYNAKKKTNPALKIKHYCGCRMRKALRGLGIKKHKRTTEFLGADVATIRRYIEAQWENGMSWSNWTRTGWHIDHIRPLSSFDLTDRAQQNVAFHYTNLQPLWYLDNIRKRDKWKPISEME